MDKSIKTQKEEELDRINKKICELQNKQKRLIRECDNEFLEQAKVNIGRCFFDRSTGAYVKVIDVPQRKWFSYSGNEINRYQYPAFFIGKDSGEEYRVIPFYIATLFSGAWGEEHYPNNPYKEISKEEFDKHFIKAIEQFKEYGISI